MAVCPQATDTHFFDEFEKMKGKMRTSENMDKQRVALIVIDMQEDYIGEKSKSNAYENILIDQINNKILASQKSNDLIIYVKNVGRRRKEPYSSDFVQGLFVVSNHIVKKEKASIFSNMEFLNLLRANHISIVELIGIDGNCCVASSAIDASKCGFSVRIPVNYVGIKDKKRFTKTREKLIKAKVSIID